MTSVSVIIPTYNYARYLGEAIESVLNQTRSPLEVIVVDDGSTDETPSVIAGFGPRVRGVRKANGGVSAALNAGAARAEGHLFAFLDADDVWLPAKLARQVAMLDADGSLGLVHCGVEEIGADGRTLGYSVDGLSGWVSEEMLLFRRSVILAGGSSAIVPAAVFREVGGFDPRLSVSQDWDFCFRVARRHRIGFVPEVLLRYRLHGANGHFNVTRMASDMLWAYAKAFTDPDLAPLQRIAYARLHLMLAGSFYQVGHRRAFARHAFQSLRRHPAGLLRMISLPARVAARMVKGDRR